MDVPVAYEILSWDDDEDIEDEGSVLCTFRDDGELVTVAYSQDPETGQIFWREPMERDADGRLPLPMILNDSVEITRMLIGFGRFLESKGYPPDPSIIHDLRPIAVIRQPEAISNLRPASAPEQ